MLRQDLPPLHPSAKRSVWRMDDHAGDADKEFQSVRRVILEAYDYTCAYCSQTSEKYQEVHHKDDDHKNNAKSNLVCTCPLCHQVFHIGLAGMKDGADIAYLPELTQAEINQLALVTWLFTETDDGRFDSADDQRAFAKFHALAKSIQGLFENRRGTVQLRLKEALKKTTFPQELLPKIKFSHVSPTLIATVFMQLDEDTYERRGELLGGLRIIPRPVRFKKQIAHWSAETDRTLPVSTWHKLLGDADLTNLVVNANNNIKTMLEA